VPQRRFDSGFAVPCCQVQQLHVFLGGPRRLLLDQHVVGQAKATRREQVAAVAIIGERSRLAHQPIDDVTVVDTVLAPTAQARQRLHQTLPVPHLQAFGVQPSFDTLADQPTGHRVGVAFDMQRAARVHTHVQTFAGLQPPRGQRPQLRQLLGQSCTTARVPLRE
jgi:hypothetical protein